MLVDRVGRGGLEGVGDLLADCWAGLLPLGAGAGLVVAADPDAGLLAAAGGVGLLIAGEGTALLCVAAGLLAGGACEGLAVSGRVCCCCLPGPPRSTFFSFT